MVLGTPLMYGKYLLWSKFQLKILSFHPMLRKNARIRVFLSLHPMLRKNAIMRVLSDPYFPACIFWHTLRSKIVSHKAFDSTRN